MLEFLSCFLEDNKCPKRPFDDGRNSGDELSELADKENAGESARRECRNEGITDMDETKNGYGWHFFIEKINMHNEREMDEELKLGV